MVVRRVWRFGSQEGVTPLARVAVDRLKTATRPYVGLDFWLRYHTAKNALLFEESSVADPLVKRWIDPERVKYRPRYGPFDRITNIGNVRGGSWDRSVVELEGHPTYRGLSQRFVEGRAWEDTVYFEHNAERIASQNEAKGCSTVDEFLEVRCSYLDDLYERIRDFGYKTQAELGSGAEDANKNELSEDRLRTNEVGVNVGRDGRLLLNSGFHRFSIAKILDLEEVPVQVIVRHWGWQKLREEITTAETASSLSKQTRRRLTHPDLVDVAIDETPPMRPPAHH